MGAPGATPTTIVPPVRLLFLKVPQRQRPFQAPRDPPGGKNPKTWSLSLPGHFVPRPLILFYLLTFRQMGRVPWGPRRGSGLTLSALQARGAVALGSPLPAAGRTGG